MVFQLRAAGGHAVGAGGAAPGEGAELPAAGGELHPGHGAEAASVSQVLKVGELLYCTETVYYLCTSPAAL